ncbi:MAG: YeeE/YedE thiosulfate transporter family protein [Desulfobacteria bacterium]
MKKTLATIVAIGALIGLLNLTHYFVSAQISGVEIPFGLFPGGFPVAFFLGVTGRQLSPELLVILILGLGILAGATISAHLSGELTLAGFKSRKLNKRKVARATVGGVLMGAGIWMAQGCLIKHVLTGTPGLMLSSLLTVMGIVVGIWISTKVAERFE